MLIQNLELNGIKLDVAVVMSGQKEKDIRLANGWPKYGGGLVTIRQSAFDGTGFEMQQEMVSLLKENGVDVENMVAWIEKHHN